jgi:phosphate transport system permease protein
VRWRSASARLGVLAGTWLAEYGNARKAGTVVRFVNDILLSAPSIVLGLFVYTLYVMQTGGNFSAFAGALSLAFIVLPVVVRTTDEMLRWCPRRCAKRRCRWASRSGR